MIKIPQNAYIVNTFIEKTKEETVLASSFFSKIVRNFLPRLNFHLLCRSFFELRYSDGKYTIAANDVLTMPNISAKIGEGPFYHAYFNQLKQEYVSARYLYYEGIVPGEPHFSDKDVLLYNSFDYPIYSLAIEKVKAAFKMNYSLLDKIAFFLNDYLALGIEETRVSFKTFWYQDQKRKKGLRPEFQDRPNLPMRGLFWLSKDLFEQKPGFIEAVEPDARELAVLRNHLEHKYLKLHDFGWHGKTKEEAGGDDFIDRLSYSLYRNDFEKKTLKLMKIVRSALIYLSLAVHTEEKNRNKIKQKLILENPLDRWEDDWKI